LTFKFGLGAVQAATSRLIFSYARDDNIPLSKYLKMVSKKTQIPTYATLFSAIIPVLVILTVFLNVGKEVNINVVIVNYAVVGIYIAFQVFII
jgi:amino acid transporter